MTAIQAKSTQSIFEPTESRISGAWSTQWVAVTNVLSADGWFFNALDSVREYVHLNPNWDGYGSPPVHQRVVETTVSLLARFAAETARLPLPEVAPVSGGGLHVEFEVGLKGLEIEILPDTTIEIVLSDGDEDAEVSGRVEWFNVPLATRWLLEESC
jgi:hypothetical protein